VGRHGSGYVGSQWWHSDASARALVQGYSRNIALVIYQPGQQAFLDPYIPHVLTGITEAAQEQGFRVTIEVIREQKNVNQISQLLRSGVVDGIITEQMVGTDELIDAGLRYDDPIVISGENPEYQFHSVWVNMITGQRALIQNLIDMGHDRIACIPYTSPQKSRSLTNRLDDFSKQLAQADITQHEGYMVYGDYRIETAYSAMQQLLKLDRPPTAVFAMNDSMAFGAIRAIYDAGLSVPGDIAVVGHDNHRNGAWSIPTLTTVSVPWSDLGSIAASTLIKLIKGQQTPERMVELETQVIVRESCGTKQAL
ncbi:MAG: substrate-binding domain-containing protein, partial [Chloroflexota bacterium]